jgi:hypothetical protein
VEGKTGRLVFEFVGRFFIGERVTRVSRERDFKDFLSSFRTSKKDECRRRTVRQYLDAVRELSDLLYCRL